MRTKRAIAAELMERLKRAYVAIDAEPPWATPEDEAERVQHAIGFYDGLKRAYVVLTGRSEQDVANEVVSWYVGTPEYQEAKRRYPR